MGDQIHTSAALTTRNTARRLETGWAPQTVRTIMRTENKNILALKSIKPRLPGSLVHSLVKIRSE
jgi:hypothetical protein